MASFPTSVKTFTNKSAGQTIASAHVNDLQDEVNAIEAGYLQGTARLNSSASTMATLQVNGGSTFSGPVLISSLAVSSNAVVNGALTAVSGFQSNGGSTLSGGLTCAGSTHSGVAVFNNKVNFVTSILWSNPNTPTALSSGNTNDYNPTNNTAATVFRLSGHANGSTLTGWAGPESGRVIWIWNVSANDIVFVHSNGGSSAGNRFGLFGGSNVTLPASYAIGFWYDSDTNHWRQMSRST